MDIPNAQVVSKRPTSGGRGYGAEENGKGGDMRDGHPGAPTISEISRPHNATPSNTRLFETAETIGTCRADNVTGVREYRKPGDAAKERREAVSPSI